nr:MAG TPA: hypothetical protein [Caudoviricetes sp.]DAY63414.1 MAG TPA: hypothetical protein [Caudoviricetes sp.]
MSRFMLIMKKIHRKQLNKLIKTTSFMMNYVCLSPLLPSRGLFFIVLFGISLRLNFSP